MCPNEAYCNVLPEDRWRSDTAAVTCGGERAYLVLRAVLGVRGRGAGGLDRGPSAALRRLHLDQPVLRRHVLDLRRACGARSGGEGHGSARCVRILEVQLLLEFVGGEDVWLRGQ